MHTDWFRESSDPSTNPLVTENKAKKAKKTTNKPTEEEKCETTRCRELNFKIAAANGSIGK